MQLIINRPVWPGKLALLPEDRKDGFKGLGGIIFSCISNFSTIKNSSLDKIIK